MRHILSNKIYLLFSFFISVEEESFSAVMSLSGAESKCDWISMEVGPTAYSGTTLHSVSVCLALYMIQVTSKNCEGNPTSRNRHLARAWSEELNVTPSF